MRSIRAITPKTHVPINEARGQLLKRRINVDEHIDEATHVRPPGQLQSQVVPLRNHNTVKLDGQGCGDGFVQVAPVIGGQNDAVRAAHTPEHCHVSAHVKGIGCALMVGQSALSQQRVRHMEAIHRHQACNRNARLGQGDRQLRRNRALPSPRRASQPQHAHGGAAASALSHGLDDARRDRRSLRAHLHLAHGLMTGRVDQGKLIHLSVCAHT